MPTEPIESRHWTIASLWIPPVKKQSRSELGGMLVSLWLLSFWLGIALYWLPAIWIPLGIFLPCRVIVSSMIVSLGNGSFLGRAAFAFYSHVVFDLFLFGPTILFSRFHAPRSLSILGLLGDCGAFCILAAIGTTLRVLIRYRLGIPDELAHKPDLGKRNWTISDLLEITFWVAAAMACVRTQRFDVGFFIFAGSIVLYPCLFPIVLHGLGAKSPELFFKIGRNSMSLCLASLVGGCFFGPIALAFFPFSLIATFVGVTAVARTIGLRVVNETDAPTRPTTEESLRSQTEGEM